MTDTVPKILVPVRGTPLCDRIVDSLIEAGIERIIFIVGYLSERIVEHYGRHPHSAKFEYIEQATLDGTGGAVRLALPVVEEDFLVIFGDSLFARNAVASVVNAPARNAIGVVEVPDPERFGSSPPMRKAPLSRSRKSPRLRDPTSPWQASTSFPATRSGISPSSPFPDGVNTKCPMRSG